MQPLSVLELLRTHTLVDHEDMQKIKSKSEYYGLELATWQERLDSILILANLLQTKVDSLKKTRDIYASYMAPVQSLPAELLSRIFADTYEEDQHFDVFPRGGPARRLTSHSLVHVCKFWRTVAIQTRVIWHHSVTLTPGRDVAVNEITARLQEIAALYGENLTRLSIRLRGGHTLPEFVPSRDLILPYQGHLKRMALIGDVFEGSGAVTISNRSLEELLLSAEGPDYRLSSKVIFDCPTLTKLSLYYPPESLAHLTIQWHHVTCLSLGFPLFDNASPEPRQNVWHPLETILGILRHCSFLVHLNLTALSIAYPVNANTPVPPVALPRLRTLELSDPFFRTASAINRSMVPAPAHPWPSLLTHISAHFLEQFDWIIPGKLSTSLFYSVQSISHFLRTTPRVRLLRVAVCDFRPPSAGQPSHILRFIGTDPQCFGQQGIDDISNEGALKLMTQRTSCIHTSPVMLIQEHPVEPKHCDYIDNVLEGEDPDAFIPVEIGIPPGFTAHHTISRVVFETLFGAEGVAATDCERRLYIARSASVPGLHHFP